MPVQKTCPNCGASLEKVYQPSTKIFQKIGLADGIYCAHCKAKLTKKISRMSLFLYAPYALVLCWNVFVNLYGKQHYELEKLDSIWVVVTLLLFIVGLIQQIRVGSYIVDKRT